MVAAGDCLLVNGRAEESLKYLDRALKMRGWEPRALSLKLLALADLGLELRHPLPCGGEILQR